MFLLDPTGVLSVDGVKLFPIGVSNPPPLGSTAPDGRDALAELKAGGVSVLRVGRGDWNLADLPTQLAETQGWLDAAAASGLHCWLWLGEAPALPAQSGSQNEQIVRGIVNAVKGHPGLGPYKGIDEPHNRFRPRPVDPQAMARARALIGQLDPERPLVVIHEPQSDAAALRPYSQALDIVGTDIYPVSYPPGSHVNLANGDLSLVGDMTRKMKQVAGGKAVWMTLQIAWSGVCPTKQNPDIVPCFPSLHDERFMAYQAIANGARGLVFFGGHLTQIARPADARAGWNWTFWQNVLRPLLAELTSTAVNPSLIAPDTNLPVRTSTGDVEHVTRRDARFLYVIAVKRGGSTATVRFTGLPSRQDGTPLTGGQVLFEYTQDPLPPPIQPDSQQFRTVNVSNGSFSDWFAPHDAHVYRFQL